MNRNVLLKHILVPATLLSAVTLVAQTSHTSSSGSSNISTEPRSEVTPANPNPVLEPVIPGVLPGQPQADATDTEGRGSLDKLVDARLDNIEKALENAPSNHDRQQAESRLSDLRQRREQLRNQPNDAEYDRLVDDTRAEYAQVASWSSKRTGDQPSSASNNASSPGSGTPTGLDRTYAALNLPANQALANIEVYRLNPSPDNKQEVKSALKSLDKEIDRLEDEAGRLPRGEERDNAKRRVKALKQRYSELKNDFTKARWDAMISDLRAEWGRIVH